MYYNFFFSFNSGCKSTGGGRADGGAYPGAAPGGARREAEGRRRGAADDLCLERRYRGGRRRDRRNADHAGPCNRIGKRREKPVEIVVLGQVSVDTWTSPTVETTLRGGDENAELLFEYCSASDGAYNISLADALTIDDIKFNCNYTDYFLADIMVPIPSLPTVIRWSSPRACSAAIIPQTPLLTVKHVAHPAAM